MIITAVYYCENSSPYKVYSLDVCDHEDKRLAYDNRFKSILWEIFEERLKEDEYPRPSSDVVFLYTDQLRSTNVAAQMMNENDDA
jgi:hypothetical protein